MDRSRIEGGLYRTKQGGVDYSHDFFGKAAFLTVSGQLQAEYYATALSNVYTFAPTFRAEGTPFVHTPSLSRYASPPPAGLLLLPTSASLVTPRHLVWIATWTRLSPH